MRSSLQGVIALEPEAEEARRAQNREEAYIYKASVGPRSFMDLVLSTLPTESCGRDPCLTSEETGSETFRN